MKLSNPTTRTKVSRRFLAIALAAMVIGSAPVALAATSVTPVASASAHDKVADVTCTTATVSAKNYDKNATIKVTLDNVVKIDGKIPGTGYSLNEALDPTVNHTLIVTIRSNDGAQYNLDFSKTTTDCKPVVAPPTQTVNCDVITGNYNRPLTNGDHINATITPPGSQVNMYVDQNVAGGASYNGQNNLGLRWKILGVEQTPIPLTLDQVKAGIISLPYGAELKKTQATWTVSFVQTNETDTWPNFNCNTNITIPTPAAVTASDVCGVDNDKLNVPQDTDKVAYTVTDSRVKGVGPATVKATAKFGFVFDKNAVTSWTFQFTNEPCPIVITTFATASAVDKCDIKNDTLTVPKDTEQVDYTVTDTRVAGVGSVTVMAAAKTGYEFKKDAVTSWTFQFTNEACPLVVTTPASVTAEDKCGTINDKLNVPKDTNEVDYTVTDTRVAGVGSVTVEAAAKAGFVLKEGSTKSWTFQFTNEPCVTVITTFAIASAADSCGVANDTLTVPKDTEQVAYTVTDTRVDGAGSVTVTAAAKTGYEFKKDAVTSWTFQFTNEACIVTITKLAAVTATDVCGIDKDTLTVPKDTDQVAYTVNDTRIKGVGSVTVNATAKAGYELDKSIVSTWTFKFTNEACPVTTTPKPVTPSGGIDTGLFGSDPSAGTEGLNPIGLSVLVLMVLAATAASITIVRKRRKTAANTAGE